MKGVVGVVVVRGGETGGMIDVELVSCITNSPLLHRQRAERKRGRMKSIELIKVEDSGISLC